MLPRATTFTVLARLVSAPPPSLIGRTGYAWSGKSYVTSTAVRPRQSRQISQRKTNTLPPEAAVPVHDPSIPPTSLQDPAIHPRTHNIPVAILHFRSHSTGLLNLFLHFVLHSAYGLSIPLSRPASLPTQRTLWTVLKGPFAHKKSQENFERLVHKRAVKVWDTDSSVMDIWIKYLEANALGGVGMRVVRWDREEVGFGAKRKEYVLARLEKTLRGHRGEVRDLGEKIVEAEKKASEAAKQQAPPPSTSSDAGEASPST